MSLSLSPERLAQSDGWYFDARKWPVCRAVIRKAQECGVPFAIGGSFASLAYSGSPEEPGDLDAFILRSDREMMTRITLEAGLHDYYDEKPYDRAWIYRAAKGDAIVDIIWAMANQRTEIDRAWLERGPEVGVDGVRFRLIPLEELLWAKLYIIQHDRCDWPDALNLLCARRREFDWRYLLARLSEDEPLLSSLLLGFSWICPDEAAELPGWLWDELRISRPLPNATGEPEISQRRANLLDTRPWLVAAMKRKEAVQK